MQSTRDLKRRLKSIKNTYKVTKAMELVSGAKMHKAVTRVLASREYAGLSWQILLNLKNRTKTEKGLLARFKKSHLELLVIVAPDKGLCGGLNARLGLKLFELLKSKNSKSCQVIVVGKKAVQLAVQTGLEIIAKLENALSTPALDDVLAIAGLILSQYESGKFRIVNLLYTDYYSAWLQKPIIKQLLPLTSSKSLGSIRDYSKKSEPLNLDSFKFEPSLTEILKQTARRILEIQIYQAILEASASEHSARMMAMRNASDNASGLASDLALTYNSARQAAITREIAEISASRL